MKRTAIRILAAGSVIAVLASGSAIAQTKTWQDATGDTNNNGLLDIGAVTVKNSKAGVTASFRFPAGEGLLPAGAVSVYLDTNPRKPGPEMVSAFGIPGDGGTSSVKDWKVTSSKKWSQDPEPTRCGKTIHQRVDFDEGIVKYAFSAKKGCLYHPAKVRVYVKTVVSGEFPDDFNYDEWVEYDSTEVDYYPSKHNLSAWVKYE